MRNKAITRRFYTEILGFEDIGAMDYPGYLIVKKDAVEIHFFEFKDLDPFQNYGQVYIRLSDIREFYQSCQERKVPIPEGGRLEKKPWGQTEFSILDPDHNLLTFGEPES